MSRKPDFTDTLAKMSDDALLDYAEGHLGSRHQRAAAITELRQRVRKGEINDPDLHHFRRAAKVLNLA